MRPTTPNAFPWIWAPLAEHVGLLHALDDEPVLDGSPGGVEVLAVHRVREAR